VTAAKSNLKTLLRAETSNFQKADGNATSARTTTSKEESLALDVRNQRLKKI
jgi:hypothetical protein